MADLEADVRAILRDFNSVERQIIGLRISFQGEDGRGGLVGGVNELTKQVNELYRQNSELSKQFEKISTQQLLDARTQRVSIWFPTVISVLALLISIIALINANVPIP